MGEWLSEFMQKLVHPLVLFGFAGQFVFMLRFVVQWLASERRGKSYVPVVFWWISLCGGLMLCTYGLLDQDPVIMLGQGLGIAIYVRNLVLIYGRRARVRNRSIQRAATQAAPAENFTDTSPVPPAADAERPLTTADTE